MTYDLVLHGATSFVGQITARYLFERHHVGGDLAWAISGRSRSKLEQVRASLGPEAAELPILVADAHDRVQLQALVDDTRVVLSTVGPYALYGSLLVELCAASGTDYADLAGEAHWHRAMIDAHQDTARETGARLVPSSGFDSIPSDLGVHHLQGIARERFGAPATSVKGRVGPIRGTASGGTLASMMNLFEELKDPDVRASLANPFVLVPDAKDTVRQPEVTVPTTDPDFDGAVVAPWVMAAINTRVVHRSNHLQGDAYGSGFTYDEALSFPPGPAGWAQAAAVTAGTGGLAVGGALPPTRWLMRKVLPSPGEGPSPEAQRKGHFTLRFHGTTDAGEVVRTRVTGDRDPGYGSTAKMFGEVGACLATDLPSGKKAPAGGFWTPAALLGDDLRERLVAHAGLTFDEIG